MLPVRLRCPLGSVAERFPFSVEPLDSTLAFSSAFQWSGVGGGADAAGEVEGVAGVGERVLKQNCHCSRTC